MKLIVAGSTGFVATEVIRQALANPAVASVVALGRRKAPEPQRLDPGADVSKFTSVVLENFDNEYPESVKGALAGADACIWTIAVTPSKSKTVPREQVIKVSRDYAVKCLETLSRLPREGDSKKPLRFIYISGHKAERDQSKKPLIIGDYLLIRGEAETRILETAKQTGGAVQAAVAKPGLISGPGKKTSWLQRTLLSLIGLPSIEVSEIAAALLQQAVKGVEKETLSNDDMIRIAREMRARQ
ncbi:uncharacterized protein THITE_2148503 [Thermothielavioides terrestris NRRL 8126]|uniref:Uncharacterized protein n=1 Tax=Thermothielavioides terrestris (strain ATCC 38088 / NRRL 8126) TaxID=578455 RepID=G2RGU8_THETT|nr:uncharacterized protein THITE_2148503 [Thermothielavioides terrestris NRRL 8126]AEO71933.1 hypothetical protein THITE_2148503 [Thermothielavioides terrestris NRRL 8126]